MGQDISAIITKGHINVPDSIVHFKELDSTIIILDLDAGEISMFIEAAAEFEDFDIFVQSLKENDFKVDSDFEDEAPFQMETWIYLVDIIESLGVKSWFIEHYSEFASMIAENHFMPVIDGKIIEAACVHRVNDHEYRPVEIYKQKMGLARNWVADEKRYFSFGSAKREYNLLKEQGKA